MVKKVFLAISLLLYFGLFTSCTKHQEIPIGTKPTKDFIVVDYISDNAIYQASLPLIISGESEPGVVMVCKFTNNKGNVLEEKYVTTNELGKWNIEIDDTPKSSNKKYQLVISTTKEEYVKRFENIRFGESILLIGDELSDDKNYEIDEKIINNENYMIFKDGRWQEFSSENKTLTKYLLNEFANSLDSPISIVDATASSPTRVYQWLDSETIDSRPQIKSYLENHSIYNKTQNELNKNDVSYYAINNFAKIKNMSFKTLIWSQGSADFNIETTDEYRKLYWQMLFTVMLQFEENFKTTDNFYIIQEGSSFVENIEQLRKIQSSICYFFAQCKVIPTYDLNMVYDKIQGEYISLKEVREENVNNYEIKGYDLEALAKRIKLVDQNKVIVPNIKNVIRELDEDKNTIGIRLIFDFELNFESLENIQINGLKFYNKNGQKIDCEYVFEKNEVIISPVLEKTAIEREILDNLTFQIYEISYAQESFIYGNNFIINDVAVVPFSVVIQ